MKFTTILSVGMLLLGVAEAQVCYRCFYTQNIGCGACNDKATKYDGEGGDTYWCDKCIGGCPAGDGQYASAQTSC
ncbi:hypothetical protein CDEST_09391 [Colletotrichum destructivum]|uniref:Uncharacterized protein n=1 Tax=Colletotrichum destructivum TaxID=34406 RepID=A0AAX4IMB9_9PEZI|nr:hypothetical protein CDEST_09391 [Colletotrichum destructivum]